VGSLKYRESRRVHFYPKRRKALDKHIGACVILCQCIEHSLAMLPLNPKDFHTKEVKEPIDALAERHTISLERHLRNLQSSPQFDDLLLGLPAIIERRNKLVHRAIVSRDVLDHLEGTGKYDFEADLDAFRKFLALITDRMDSLGIGTASHANESILRKVRADLIVAIEENRTAAARKMAQKVAKPS
jgi:hypothetical protein